MKNYVSLGAACLAILLCGSRAGDAQTLVSSSAPIMIGLSEIDRAHVYVHSPKEPLGQWRLGIVLRELPQLKADDLVRRGVFMCSPVWVTDGKKILLKLSPPVGEAGWSRGDGRDEAGQNEFGLLVGFSSQEEAEKAATVLRLQRNP